MNTSESINKIAPALLKAQKAITFAIKDSKNPHFKSTYADLGSVIEACKTALNEAGIAFMQMPAPSEHGSIALTTRLLHESGEWIESTATCPLPKNDPQGYGSANTYLRRYSLAAAVGLYQDDDDGNAASKAPAAVQSVRHSPTQGAMDEVQDDERRDYLRTLGSVLKVMVDKGDVGKAYERLLKEKLDDTEYTALWEVLKEHSYVRSRLKAHGETLRAAKVQQPTTEAA